MRSSLRDERGAVGAERVVAWLLVVLAIAFAVAVVSGPGATVASGSPDATFDASYDGASNTLRIEHVGGDAIRRGATSSLVVVVSDADSDNRRNVTWVADGDDGAAAYPVEPGDSIAVDDASVDADDDGNVFDANATVGFTLDADDAARVVWRGRPLGAPGQVNATLDTVTVEESG